MMILVIHPSPTVRYVLRSQIEREGHQVLCFGNPVVAWSALFHTKMVPLPDILFLTIASTSQVTEYALLRLFKAHGPQIPVVVMCPRDNALLHLKAHLAGATLFFLGEPMLLQQVIALVRRIATRSDTSTI
ncbi:MAG: response regulator [Ktedonobacteraceae bacterium]|nr:response regulator [Ktedonobacteraceae bacterium]